MRRTKAQSIGDLVRQFLREEGLETPLNQRRLIDAWPTVCGPAVAHYTTDLAVRGQTLYVHLTSSVLRQELMMQRRTLVARLNTSVGAQVISDIVFR